MTYYLNYALHLEYDTAKNVVYKSEQFEDNPTPITTSRLEKIIEKLINSNEFTRVGIVEDKKNDDSKKITNKNLQGLSGEAYIAEIKKLDNKESQFLDQLNLELVSLIQEISNNISRENFLEPRKFDDFSTLRQIVELRDYIMRFILNKTKGYLFIMKT